MAYDDDEIRRLLKMNGPVEESILDQIQTSRPIKRHGKRWLENF